jgi:hypothetical protein
MYDISTRYRQRKFSSKRILVYKRHIIRSSTFVSQGSTNINQNCFDRESIKSDIVRQTNVLSNVNESTIDIAKQRLVHEVTTNNDLPLFYELLRNAWPISDIHVEHTMVTLKRCQFSNEAISIKPVTASTYIH